MCRQQSGFVGLKNGGATCYMNAVFQQLFMQPSIRALVLGAKEVPLAERKDSVFFQFQVRLGTYTACMHCKRCPRICQELSRLTQLISDIAFFISKACRYIYPRTAHAQYKLCMACSFLLYPGRTVSIVH